MDPNWYDSFLPHYALSISQALGNRQSASAAVGLLCAAFRFLPFELYCNHFQVQLHHSFGADGVG